jgi:glycosyltransferase involved in cell wall biosynthesis
MEKVSIIIATFNRFKYLLNAIKSVKNQTYKNIEIIVVNDCSTEPEYYNYNFEDIKIIHLKENTKTKFGYASGGHVRTIGMKEATGYYIAFLDDDDIWFPQKLELQISEMKINNCKMSCTDGLFGRGIYDPSKKYKKYVTEEYFRNIQIKFKNLKSNLLDNGMPKIWNLEFQKLHNCCVCSSVVVEKSILENIGYMKDVRNGVEDKFCWLNVLNHTNCLFIKDVCFYYDAAHGDGKNY